MKGYLKWYQALTLYKFTALLVFQLIFILVYPLCEGGICEWILHTVATAVFLWMLFVCSKNRLQFKINIAFSVIAFFTYLLDYLHYFEDVHLLLPIEQFSIFYCCVFVLFYIYTTGLLCFHMLTDRKPHIDTLSGTAAVYLTIALTWTFFYLSLENFTPQSFHHNLSQNGITYINWLFYSISTLVSSSFSGIVPATSMAQSISILESIIGALYIAIITARIVGVDFDDPRRIRHETIHREPDL